jgi:4-alpha-glucanotransferase
VLATTHDLPPLAGYFAGRDLELRGALDRSARPETLLEAKRGRAEERAALVATLRDEGELPTGEGPVEDAALDAAVNAHLARTPARLVALGLDDLAGETEPLNLPGVPVERHRSWSRRMRRTLDELAADPGTRARVERAAERIKPRAARPENGSPAR